MTCLFKKVVALQHSVWGLHRKHAWIYLTVFVFLSLKRPNWFSKSLIGQKKWSYEDDLLSIYHALASVNRRWWFDLQWWTTLSWHETATFSLPCNELGSSDNIKSKFLVNLILNVKWNIKLISLSECKPKCFVVF